MYIVYCKDIPQILGVFHAKDDAEVLCAYVKHLSEEYLCKYEELKFIERSFGVIYHNDDERYITAINDLQKVKDAFNSINIEAYEYYEPEIKSINEYKLPDEAYSVYKRFTIKEIIE